MAVPATSPGVATGAVASEAISLGPVAPALRLPDIEVQPPFILFHHPSSWMVVEVDGEPRLLPQLSQVAAEPGIGMVDRHGDPSQMIGRKLQRGWTMIPESAATAADTTDGRPGYLRRTQARRGATHHTAWSSWRVVAGRASLVTDQPRYHAWLQALLDRAIVAPPDPAIIERKLDEGRVRLERASGRELRPGSRAAALAEAARDTVEALEALSPAASPESPAARPRKRREAASVE